MDRSPRAAKLRRKQSDHSERDGKQDDFDLADSAMSFMYDALARHRAIESLATRDSLHGQLRKYYRFRADRWYGGIATGDVVGCGLLCKFCWVSENILERPDKSGQFLAPHEAAQKLLRVAESRHLAQIRLSGGEPTIGRPHLLSLLSEIDEKERFRFILETNGILLGADRSYCKDLARFRCLHVRVSFKGSSESEFGELTGAGGEAFTLQADALKNLSNERVSCHPAVMSSFSKPDSLQQLRERLFTIDRRLVHDLEIEELIRYPRVERRLQRYGLKPRISHDPRNVPERLV